MSRLLVGLALVLVIGCAAAAYRLAPRAVEASAWLAVQDDPVALADRALDKADRMGLRRARINDVSRRTIKVSGRNRDGDRLTIVFDRRDRRCPMIDRYFGY